MIKIQPTITINTSAVHLKMVRHAFRKATSREDRVLIAETHKPYMLESDIKQMREDFKNLPNPMT